MDGVEYIDAVIFALREAFPTDQYEVRVDADVFVAGESLRANVEREINDAEIVLVLLDGLRPNVVYELGMAHALQRRLGAPAGSQQRRVIPLAEINATVLVRNLYPEPLKVPMRDGSTNTPLNPPLRLETAWSDGSDILVQRYDRLKLHADIRRIVDGLVASMSNEPSKGALVAESFSSGADDGNSEGDGASDEQSADHVLADLRKLYREGDYAQVVKRGSGAQLPKVRKLVALSLMRLGRISEAMDLWSGLEEEAGEVNSALFHLGVCNYVISEFTRAHSYFQRAVEGNYGKVANRWLSRARDKLGEPRTEAANSGSSEEPLSGAS